MGYYKRRKHILYDEPLEQILKTIGTKLEEIPQSQRKKTARKIMQGIHDDLPDLLDEVKDEIIKKSRRDVRKAIKYDRKELAGFEKRLYKSYQKTIDNYTELIGVCVEAVQSHREIIHNSIGEKDAVLPTVLRLHARILRIANEIKALARSGYGTGALSRWRSMHETAVVMAYLIEKGPRAIRIMQDHQAVSNYKAMKDYQTYSRKLGEEPYTAYEMRLARLKYERRLNKYDYGRRGDRDKFKKDYGWASVLTPSVTDFRSLERYVGIDHLRPYYKLASLGVHMEWSSLTTGEEFAALQDPGIVLIGPADYGFEDAINLSSITLSHATTLILTYNLSVKSLVYTYVIKDVLERIEEELIKESSKMHKSDKSDSNE